MFHYHLGINLFSLNSLEDLPTKMHEGFLLVLWIASSFPNSFNPLWMLDHVFLFV
jgi:hypothetical protein